MLTPDLKDVDVFVHTCTQSPKPWLPSQPTPHEVITALNSQASLRCSYLPTKAVPYQSSNPVPAPLGAHTPCLQCAPSKTTMTPPRSETECAPQQKWAASSGGVSLDCQPRKMVIEAVGHVLEARPLVVAEEPLDDVYGPVASQAICQLFHH